MRIVVVSFIALGLVGCSAPESSVAPSSGRVAQSQSAEGASAPGNPASVLAMGKTYWFSFDESKTVFDAMSAKCAKESEGKADQAPACLDAIRREAAREAIRFSGSDPQHLTWTSFGVDEAGKEELYLEVPMAVVGTEGTVVEVKPTGPAHGPQAAEFGAEAKPNLHFDVVDAGTIAMNDARKGRLLFRAR